MDYSLPNPAVSQMRKYFQTYQQTIYPLVAQAITQNQTQKLYGMHGLNTHTASVVFRGIDFALSINQDPIPVIFACAFHDMARTNDGFDTEHGRHAVPMATQIMQQFNLSDEIKQSIIFAIENHTTGTDAPDYISGALWGADRVRLSQLYNYDEKYYSNPRAKQIASLKNYEQYLEFQRQCFPNIHWDKIY